MAVRNIEQSVIARLPCSPPQQRQVHHRIDRAGARRPGIRPGAERLNELSGFVEPARQHVRGGQGRFNFRGIEVAQDLAEGEGRVKEEAQIMGGLIGCSLADVTRAFLIAGLGWLLAPLSNRRSQALPTLKPAVQLPWS